MRAAQPDQQSGSAHKGQGREQQKAHCQQNQQQARPETATGSLTDIPRLQGQTIGGAGLRRMDRHTLGQLYHIRRQRAWVQWIVWVIGGQIIEADL